jgi:flagellin
MAESYAPGEAARYSMQLLRGQMLDQLLLGQISGISLSEFVLGKPAMRSGRAMMNDALTGLMRSDAAMLHQASKNMGEGEAISKLAAEGLQSIQEKISRMRDIAAQVQTSGLAATQSEEAEYMSLAGQIKAVVENTGYNGIKLLDGDTWAGEPRIADGGNSTGKLSLQAGTSSAELTLYGLEYLKSGFNTAQLGAGQLSATISSLDMAQRRLNGMRESYTARAGLYASEAASYERQAGILEEASGKASPGDEQSLKDALLNILLREQGMLVNYSS